MSTIEQKIDKLLQLTDEEQLLIHGPKKRINFVPVVPEPPREYHIFTSHLEMSVLIEVLMEAVKQLEFCLIQIPDHEKPPRHTFDNTLEAFLHRQHQNDSVYVLYEKQNRHTLNIAKLFMEYEKCISILYRLIDDLKKTHCYLTIKHNIKQMNELKSYLKKLDQDNIKNIKLLRKREIEYVTLAHINIKPTKQLLELNSEFVKLQNEYHDVRLLKARQLRYNKNLLNAQMAQLTWREKNKYDSMLNEINHLSQLCEQEILVFEESSRFQTMAIQEYKDKVEKMSEAYENDIITSEFEIARVQSELNYFEEMWNKKFEMLEYMKVECDKYIESVCQRNREIIAKRLGHLWISSARKTIADRKRKAKRLAKKNKGKKKV